MNTRDTELIHAAIDAGINYIDTAHVYMNGINEQIIGNVMKTKRDKVFLTTKLPSWDDHKKWPDMIKTSLKRLNTDHVDLVLLHDISDSKFAINDNNIKLFDDIRKDGYTRFVGISTHSNQAEVLEAMIKSKFWEAALVGYNYYSPPNVSASIKKAREAGIAIIGMKNLLNAQSDPWEKLDDIRKDKKIDITPPPVPSGLQITSIGNGAVSLEWEIVPDNGLEGYNVYWLGESEVDTLSANRRFVQINYATISGLDYDILYYFGVSAVDNNRNESAISVQISGKPLNTTSPLPPSNVLIVAENIDYPKIAVFWSPNTEPDLDHYNIYRSLDSNELDDPLSFVSSATLESYSDINVDIGVKYYYRITAVDKGGWESTPSSIVSDFILPPVELVSPVNYQYVSKTPTFSWKIIDGAVSYNIILSTSRIGGEIWNMLIDGGKSQITYNGKTKLISGNTYYWMIGAITRTEINSISAVGTFVVRSE